ncbi:hypothetical protein FAIPA1_50122 [Frankia sp. AiPs1]
MTTGADGDGGAPCTTGTGHRSRGMPATRCAGRARVAEDVAHGPSPAGDRAGTGRAAVRDHHDPREKP